MIQNNDYYKIYTFNNSQTLTLLNFSSNSSPSPFDTLMHLVRSERQHFVEDLSAATFEVPFAL